MRAVIETESPEAKHCLKETGARTFAKAKLIESFVKGEITRGQYLLRLAEHDIAIAKAERNYAVMVLANEQAGRVEASASAATS